MGALVAGAVLVVGEPDAQACGGCFHPPPGAQEVVSVVTDHRMVLSVSPAQTVLWDQIRYSGDPGQFAWVLPVKPGSTLQLSHDEWIAALDASTQTVIEAPQVYCGAPANAEYSSGGGGACGGNNNGNSTGYGGSGDDASFGDDGSAVTVVSEQVVGPYDVVTVRSSQGEALGAWLDANGFAVPTGLQPTIDAYTGEGFDFIALKLAPGQGIQAMQPVRVVTPGADLSLPLRMVAAGVGANVSIELWVLGEGRYHPQNFPDAAFDSTKLTWDPVNQVSNYTTLVASALAANGGRGWLTESAALANIGFGSGQNPALDATYESTCTPITLPAPPGCGQGPDGGKTDAGHDSGAFDAGGAFDAASCQPVVVQCDDLTLAMVGISNSADLWVTRLRANLPSSALANDLTLAASPTQVEVSSFYQVTAYSDPSYNPCPGSTNLASGSSTPTGGPSINGCSCRTAESAASRYTDAILGSAVLVGLAFGARRRRRVVR